MPILTKTAYDRGLSISQLMPVRFWLAAAGLTVLAVAIERGRVLLARTQFIDAVALGLLFALQTGSFLMALQYIRASVAVLLLFTFPMLIAVAGWLWLNRPITSKTLVALGIGFIGLGLAVGELSGGSWMGVVLALVSAMLNAAYFIYAEGRVSTAPTLTVCAIGLVMCALVYSAVVGVSGARAFPDRAADWALVLGLACVPVIALPTLLVGVIELGAVPSAVISAWEPVVSIGAAVALLAEPFTAWQIVGAVLVVVAVVLAQLESASPN
jgi:drug/metabolite transporter (DMT)-like permease